MTKYPPLPRSKHPWPFPGLDNRQAAHRLLENPALTKDEHVRISMALVHHSPDLDVFIPDVYAAVVARAKASEHP